MKVPAVQIITMLELGGAQEHVLCTLRGLDRRRYRPVLITGPGGPLMEDAAAMPGVERHVVSTLVREIRPVKDAAALMKLYVLLRRFVKEAKAGHVPVIVHTNSSKAGILGRLAAFFAGADIIVHTVHGFGFNDDQTWLKRKVFIVLERLTAKVTDRFIAVAQDNIGKGVREGIFRPEDAEVIRSGINTGYFGGGPEGLDKKRDELGLPAGAPVVTMVACLKPQKAPVDFVRVAAGVHESVPEAHFLLAGDGELRDDVLAEAKRLGIDGSFHLLGWRRDVRELIHLSDVVVLTSLWEGLPRVLPQAMAAGKPVVATAVDGSPEAVKDGVNGFLAGPHDTAYMAHRVVQLIKDPALAGRMGEAGRAMAGEFDEAGMLMKLDALYTRLLKEAA